MLQPEMIRTVRFKDVPRMIAAYLAVFALAWGITYAVWSVTDLLDSALRAKHAIAARVQMTYLPQLGGKAEMLRTDPYRGPVLLHARLYDQRQADRWLPYWSVDAIARRPPDAGEAAVPGCVYLERGLTCLCEPHAFLIPLADLR